MPEKLERGLDEKSFILEEQRHNITYNTKCAFNKDLVRMERPWGLIGNALDKLLNKVVAGQTIPPEVKWDGGHTGNATETM